MGDEMIRTEDDLGAMQLEVATLEAHDTLTAGQKTLLASGKVKIQVLTRKISALNGQVERLEAWLADARGTLLAARDVLWSVLFDRRRLIAHIICSKTSQHHSLNVLLSIPFVLCGVTFLCPVLCGCVFAPSTSTAESTSRHGPAATPQRYDASAGTCTCSRGSSVALPLGLTLPFR